MQAEKEIAIAGAGYVGLTSAACFCEMGHRVRLVEVNPDRLALLRTGNCPIHEPGLPEMLQRHLGDRLHLTDRLDEAMAHARVLFICVGTPPLRSGAPDLRPLRRLLQELRDVPDLEKTVVVLKSTVPPGTNRLAYRLLNQQTPVVSNPEFLREGTAIADFFHPDRIVVGSPESEAALLVAGLYAGVDAPLLLTGWEEAELIKYATNAFLSVKLSLVNELAAICDGLGVDVPDVLRGLGLDHRVGSHFLRPGPGYGGSCLPKDTRALIWKARQAHVHLDLLPAAERANARQRRRLLAKLAAEVGDGTGLAGKRIAVWGLAFKSHTDDLRGSAALDLVPQLLERGALVQAHDPAAMAEFASLFPPEELPGLTLAPDHWAALRGADALLILTEWPIFQDASPLEIRRQMAGRLVVDSRNILDPNLAASAGLLYRGVGRERPRRA